MFTGMGSLSYGELAGERMKLGLLLHDPEEEHDCFSDNTHNSHYYNVVGIRNVYLGRYVRLDGSKVSVRFSSHTVLKACARRPEIFADHKLIFFTADGDVEIDNPCEAATKKSSAR